MPEYENSSVLNQVLLHPNSVVGADLTAWLATWGGQGLRSALAAPESIIDRVREAQLRGLGGSGFPTHIKWQAVANEAEGDKYLIGNGNEDEPGTFKDRMLLELSPHQVIEGALIAALATGINHVIFYINPHLQRAMTAMQQAVAQWLESSLYPEVCRVVGRTVELQVMPSSGYYVGGEETAAIASVEGSFPFPRGKPPFPAQSGVHGKPTLINNIETLANLSHLLRNGVAWFHSLGRGGNSGTKVYSLSGDVLNPGVYELPMGITLNELIFSYGGGMLVGKKLKAVFTGGPSNTILTKNDLDVSLDFDSVRQRHSSLGTGAMIVVSEGTGIVKRVAEYVRFFADASCGQCPPCKSGTYYLSMLLDKIDTGHGRRVDLDAITNLCEMLPGSGRCHLIDGAVKVVDSSLYHFKSEYEQALRQPRARVV
ncbi:MAG: SLBB domain-containing protein [Gammaproteobacteria bacterium]|nr:SLBB domain-containing protein [Gammaproteobacteria bacterium]